ncbi:MAG: SDR family NAD(P)-dependent oxidoreductase, partial [Polyangiaceae bacterium]
MSAVSKVAVVVGVGPGLGQALAVRFAREGFRVALVARHEESLSTTRAAIEGTSGLVKAFLCDASDEQSVRDTFQRIHEELGPTEVLLYNAGVFQLGGLLELSASDVERAW